MICYEVITRREVFQDVRANFHIVINLIAARGQKPNKDHVDSVEKFLQQQNSNELTIFLMIKNLMENCWCFAPEERLTTNRSISFYLFVS